MRMKKLLVMMALLVIPMTMHSGDFVSGSQTCSTSGTIQISTTGYNLMQLTVSANLTNTGYIHLGSNTVTTSTGGVLTPAASYTAVKNSNGVNPATLYMACTVNTDGISWIGSR